MAEDTAERIRIFRQNAHEPFVIGCCRTRLLRRHGLEPTRRLGAHEIGNTCHVPLLLVFLTFGKPVRKDINALRLNKRGRRHHTGTPASGNAQVTGNSLDEAGAGDCPVTVVLLVTNAIADIDAHRLHGAHQAGDLINLLNGNSCNGGSPLGRVLLHMFGQLVKAVAPVLYEVMIVQAFSDDDVQNGHSERAVRARTNRNPYIRLRGQAVLHRTDIDDLETLFDGIEASIRIALVDCGVFAVVAPYHQKLRLAQLSRSCIRSLSMLRTAYGHQAREHALRVANSTMHVVWAAMYIQKTTSHRTKNCVELRREHAI